MATLEELQERIRVLEGELERHVERFHNSPGSALGPGAWSDRPSNGRGRRIESIYPSFLGGGEDNYCPEDHAIWGSTGGHDFGRGYPPPDPPQPPLGVDPDSFLGLEDAPAAMGGYPRMSDPKDNQGFTLGTAGDEFIWIGGDRSHVVGSDSRTIVAGNSVLHVNCNSTTRVGGHVTHEWFSGLTESVTGDALIKVTGKYTLESGDCDWFKWSQTQVIGGANLDITMGFKTEACLAALLDVTSGVHIDVKKAATFEAHSGPVFKWSPSATSKFAKVAQVIGAVVCRTGSLVQKGVTCKTRFTNWKLESTALEQNSTTMTLDATGALTAKGGKVQVEGSPVTVSGNKCVVEAPLELKKGLKQRNLKVKES